VRQQITSNSHQQLLFRPHQRSVSWLVSIVLKLGTDHLLGDAIRFVSKTVLFLEWNLPLDNGYRSNQAAGRLRDQWV